MLSTLVPFIRVRPASAPWPFLLFEKRKWKNLKLRTLQGMILEQRLRRLAPFRFPFGSIWVVLVILLAPFWISYGGVSIQWPRVNRLLTKETLVAILCLQMRWATHSRVLAYAWNVLHVLVTCKERPPRCKDPFSYLWLLWVQTFLIN